MGLVPKEVPGKVGLGEVKLVLATAKTLAEAGRDIWDAMNEEQQRRRQVARPQNEQGKSETLIGETSVGSVSYSCSYLFFLLTNRPSEAFLI